VIKVDTYVRDLTNSKACKVCQAKQEYSHQRNSEANDTKQMLPIFNFNPLLAGFCNFYILQLAWH